MALRRRRLLAAVAGGTATSSAGFAGCLDRLSDEGNDAGTGTETGGDTTDADGNESDADADDEGTDVGSASLEYTTWLPSSDDPVAFAYFDWATVNEFRDDDSEDESNEDDSNEDEEDDDSSDDEPARDPMLDLPTTGAAQIVTNAVGADLGEADVVELVADPETEEGSVFDSSVTGLLAVDDCSVVTGDIHRDEIDERLTADPEALIPVQFERSGERAGYDVYTGVDRDNRVAAVGDDAIVYRRGEGALEAVRSLVDDRVEGGVTEADDDAAWVLENGGRGHVAFGGYGGPPAMSVSKIGAESVSYDVATEFETLAAVDGVVASITAESAAALGSDPDAADTVTGAFAAEFESAADVPSSLEERLGESATDRTVSVDGDRLSATARWTDEDDADPVPRL